MCYPWHFTAIRGIWRHAAKCRGYFIVMFEKHHIFAPALAQLT